MVSELNKTLSELKFLFKQIKYVQNSINFLNKNSSEAVLSSNKVMNILEDRSLRHWVGTPWIKKTALIKSFCSAQKLLQIKCR